MTRTARGVHAGLAVCGLLLGLLLAAAWNLLREPPALLWMRVAPSTDVWYQATSDEARAMGERLAARPGGPGLTSVRVEDVSEAAKLEYVDVAQFRGRLLSLLGPTKAPPPISYVPNSRIVAVGGERWMALNLRARGWRRKALWLTGRAMRRVVVR